jgi:hypothetical protein
MHVYVVYLNSKVSYILYTYTHTHTHIYIYIYIHIIVYVYTTYTYYMYNGRWDEKESNVVVEK